jgi:hypothetical protein
LIIESLSKLRDFDGKFSTIVFAYDLSLKEWVELNVRTQRQRKKCERIN